MAYGTYSHFEKPRNPYYRQELYAYVVDEITKMQPKPAETPKPKVSYEYVIRLDSGHKHPRFHGTYVTYSDFGMPSFSRGFALKQATRWKTANDAAEALKKRNGANGGPELFSIVPVKVTVTPATTSTKTVDEVVPAKTEYVIRVEKAGTWSQPGEYVSDIDARQSFVYGANIGRAKLFASANDAARAVERRNEGWGASIGGTFAILPHSTPATTKPKTVTETIPASTTVVLA